MSGAFSLKVGIVIQDNNHTVSNEIYLFLMIFLQQKKGKKSHLRKFFCTKENKELQREGKREEWILVLQY